MRKTQFAGLTVLEPGEGLDSDNGAFIDRDRDTIDHFLRLGAKLHRHNAEAGLENPTRPASGAVIASGGTISPETTVSIGYTIEDAKGGETMLSPLAVVSTGPALDVPVASPSAAVDYTGGALLVDTYYYALTWIDGEGGETPAGPAVSTERAPGFASGRIKLSNLTYGMAAAGAVGWRLFRAKGGGTYDLLTTGGLAQSTFTDDGTTEVDCDVHPPSVNTTNHINTLEVLLPSADANISRATNINLYGSLTGDFGEASSLGQYPIASAGHKAIFRTLQFFDASPPDVNLSIGGASQIDPDTELLDWHWKRPVGASALLGSGVLGDVKLVEDTAQFFAVLSPSASAAGPKEWIPIGSAGSILASGAGGQVSPLSKLTLRASGGVNVSLSEPSGREAQYTIAVPGLRASAASASPGQIPELEQITFVGSGGLQVSLQQNGPHVANVILTAGAGAGGSGASGAEGRPAGLKYGFLTDTTETEPSTGSLKFNAGKTKLFINETDKDGNAVGPYLATFDDSASTVKGMAILRKIGSPTTFAICQVTGALVDKGAWDVLTISVVVSSGSFANGDALTLEFFRTGDPGPNELVEGTNSVTWFESETSREHIRGFKEGSLHILELAAEDGEQLSRIFIQSEKTGIRRIVLEVNGIAKVLFDKEENSQFLQLSSSRKERDFGLVEALPTSPKPVKGDRCKYIADKTNGIVWDLVYTGEGELPWSKIGGPALIAEITTSNAIKSNVTVAYKDLGTVGPTIKLPLKGDYRVDIGFSGYLVGAVNNHMRMSYALGATAAAEEDECGVLPQAQFQAYPGFRAPRVKTGLAAGLEIKAKYRVIIVGGGEPECNWERRYLRVDPVRVG